MRNFTIVLLVILFPFVVFSQIPTEGLVGYWPFYGNANDATGNEHNGTVYGPTLTLDRFGIENSAYYFDGLDDYISGPDMNFPSGNHDRTFSCWVNMNELIDGFGTILSYGSNGYGLKDDLHIASAISSHPFRIQNNFSELVDRTGNNFISYNSWYHIVYVLEDEEGIIYMNSVPLTTTRDVGSSNPSINTILCGEFRFGHALYIYGSGEYLKFKGSLDDIRIYNRALSLDEINALYNEILGLSIVQHPENQMVCKGDYVNFMVSASGEEPIFYQWQKNNENIPNATGNIFSLSNVQLSDEGEYRCIVSNNNGSDTSNTATLTVDIVPMADIFGPPSVDEWQVATYSVTPQGGHQYEFWVDGGNILQNNSNNIEVQWGAVGYGHVYMLETNVSGCMSDTNSLQVAIGSVGINSISDNESISVYPQPANEKLFINLLSNNYNLLHIADLKGNVLIEQDICSEKEVVSIESLSPGVYILSISNQFERVVKKFVKM